MNARFARWLCLVLLSAVTVRSAVVDDRIAEGRAALAAHNLSLARSKFTEARAADAANPTAAALLGLTRWFALAGDAPANAVLTGGGVSASGRDLYDWSAKLGKNAAGDAVLPTGYNLEAQRSFWRDTIIPTSVAARADFAAVTDDAFVLTLSGAEVNSGDPADTITLDRADLLTLQASLRAFEMLVQVSLGQNMSADYARLLRVAQADTLTFRQAMEDNPDLLKAGPLENRLAAKEALLDFVNLYRRASSAVRARPLGLDRLFMLDTPQDLSDEADFRRYLTSLEKSATDYVEVDNGAEHISLAPLATAGWSIRGSLPAMNNGRFDPTAIGDASLGGVVLGLRREFFAQKLVEAGYTADLGWNLITPSFNSGLQKYAYTGTHHIVTGTNGTLGRSADGATWTFQQFPQAQDLFSIATNGSGVVVAVGNTQVWRSADHGATWSLVHTTWRKTAPDNEGGMFGLVWNGTGFTALTAGGYIWRSPDGLTWTRGNRIQPASVALTMGGLDYDAGRFVAMGMATINGLSRGAIFTSTDGANWTLSFTAASNTSYRTAAYGNGRWIATGNGGRIAYSTNGGTNWAEISTGNTADNFQGSTFANGQFHLGGSRFGTSADGITWTFASNPEPIAFTDAVAGPGGVYLSGAAGALYRYASGTFTRLDTVSTNLARNAVFNESVAFNGKVYTTGSNGTITETSGNTVTNRATPVTTTLSCITVHNGELFAGGIAGTVVSSTDGVTWQVRIANDPALTTASINDLASVNGQLLAATSSFLLVSSDNGATWTRRSLPNLSSATLAIGSGGGYYLLGQVSVFNFSSGLNECAVLASTDLANFNRLVIAQDFSGSPLTSVRQILFNDGKFHVYLSSGRVLHSVSSNPNDGFTGDWDTNGTIVGGGIQAGTYYATTQRTNDESRSGLNYSFDAADWVRTELPTSEFIAGTLADLGGRLYTSGGTSIYRATKSLARPGPTAGSQVIIPARVGQSITVAAPITSSEDLTYQWSFNGSPIVGATGASLNLSQVTADQAGTYTVTATGRLTGATATNTVTVLVVAGTPTITQQPAGGLAKAGGSFTFTVTAAGTAPLSYQWFRNNQRLAAATAATLTLSNLASGDAGDYRVEVSNAAGTVISSDARLVVSAIGSAPAFWEDSESFFAPSRLISDGQGRFYAMWNIYGRAQDVVGGVHVGSLARFNEATGAVDPTFVWDEKLGSPLFLCVQTDGKLIVATNQAAGEGATVIRLNTDGSLDNTFAAPRFSRSIRFMRLQSDGKVLLAATDGVSDSSVPGMIVATNPTVYRLNATGGLDNTFAAVDLGTNSSLFSPPAVDAQGRVYLLGSFATVNGTTRRGVARVTAAGVLDSFADPATLPTGWNTSAVGRAIAFQSDGRPVIAGRFGYTARGNTSTNPILAIRFNLDGTFDTTFAQPLRSETPINTAIGFYARWIEVTAGDKFYLTCDRVMRFNANGTLDTTWAANNTGYSKELFWLMVSPTTGNLYVPDLNDVSGNILALTSAGAPLAGFNAGGFGTTRTPDDAILLADGRLLAAGNFDHFGGTVQPGTALFGTNGVLAGDATAFHDPGVIFTNPWATVFRWPDRSFGVVRAELGDPITGDGFDVKATRYNPDGTTRSGWELAEATPSSWNYAPVPDGGLLLWRVSPSATDVINQGNSAWIRRYNPDGSANATSFGDFSAFTLITRNGSNAITNIESGQVSDLQVAGDGSFLTLVAGRDGNVSLRRFLPNGNPDPGYTPVALGSATVTAGFTSLIRDPVTGTTAQFPITNYTAAGYRFRVLPDGSAYVAGRLTIAGVSRSLVKLTATGAVDASVADLTLGYTNTTGLPPRISGLGLDDSARLYFAGRFDSVNGTAAAGLARLTPTGAFDSAWAPGVQIVDPLGTGVLFAGGNGWLHLLGPVMGAGDLRPTGYKRVPLTATAPAIVGQSASRTVNEGQSVQLFAGVFGGGDMTYSWTRNGTTLTGGNQPFLDLGKVTSATAGTYVLTATNSAGTVQSTAIVLTVSNLPAIEVAPKAVTVVEGGVANFSVQATSSLPLTYQWQRNGTPIDGATAATLVLTGVTAGQAGNYTVVVSNTNGSVTSAAAALTVTPLAAAPTITTQPLSQTVYTGYIVGLGVAVTPPSGATITGYKWYQNGSLFSTSTSTATTATLTVSAPAAGASNTYQVVVTSSNGGSVTSATATITGGNPAYATSTLAGVNTRGFSDGTGTAARFSFPHGAASDAAGNVYVADSNNHTIRKVTPAGVVTTFAGQAGSNTTVDGTLAVARFSNPQGVIVATNGDVYVLQTTLIRKISGGNVTTLVGSTSSGALDGTGTAARFNNLQRGVIDSAGNLYVSDTGNHAIRKVTPAGFVTTFAGTLGFSGYADDVVGLGRLYNPRGLALKSDGTLLIVDGSNSALRLASVSGALTTLVGNPPPNSISGTSDGSPTSARFSSPSDVALDPGTGIAYVVDGAYTIRRVATDLTVTTVAGSPFNLGFTDSNTGTDARFNFPRGIAWMGNAHFAITDMSSNTIRSFGTAGDVSTLAGLPPGSADGTGSAARFFLPIGVVGDGSGNFIVSDYSNRVLRKITPAGAVTTFSGILSQATFAMSDGSAATARYGNPRGLARHPITGEIYVYDYGSIRKVAPDGSVSAFAGANNGNTGNTDGVGTAARFGSFGALAFAANGDLYVADEIYHTIRKVTSDRTVTTIAGVANSSGNVDGSLAAGAASSAVRFASPRGIAVDANGNIFVAQSSGNIRKIDPAGNVTTLTGVYNSLSNVDGGPIGARLGSLYSLTLGADGNLYAGTTGCIYRIHPTTGVVTTLLGSGFTSGYSEASGSAARMDTVTGLSVAADGTITFVDSNNGVIRRAVTAPVISFTTQPASQTVATGANVTFTAVATGVSGITYQWTKNGSDLANGGNVSGATTATLTLANVTLADAASYAVRASSGNSVAISTAATLSIGTAEANDNFANAAALTGASGTVAGNNTTATGETGEPVHFSSTFNAASSLWYAYRPIASGVATFDTIGSSIDTVLAVYTGSAVNNLTFLAQNNDATGSTASQITLPVAVGTTYYIAVASNTNTRGAFVLNHSLSVTPQPSATVLGAGQSVSFGVTPNGALNPAVTQQWRRDGADLAGATSATLANQTVAGVYTVGFAQGGALDYSRTEAVALLSVPSGGGSATDNFAGTGLSSAWNATPLTSLPDTDTAFVVNDRLEFTTLNAFPPAVYRQADRADTLPLDRNWSVVVRTGMNPSALANMLGTGSVRETGFSLVATNTNDTGDYHRLAFRYRNDAGTPRFERYMQTTTNGTAAAAAGIATLTNKSALLRFDYDAATGVLASSVSSGGSSFASIGSFNLLSTWAAARTGSIRIGLRGSAELVNIPAAAVWADDYAQAIQPAPGPVITTQPLNVSAADGSSITLSVGLSATTAGTPTYQWFKDGVAITGATASSYSDVAVAGSYTVAVTLNGQTVTSSAAVVTTTPSAPVFGTIGNIASPFSVGGYVLPAGSSSYLQTGLLAGSTPVSYQWNFNGVAIPGATGPTYYLPNWQTDNGGAYSVTASNSLGTITSPEETFWVTPEGGWRWRNPTPTGNGATRVAYLNGQFLLGGLRGTFMVSPDGVNWTTRQVPAENNLFNFQYTAGRYVAMASLNAIFTSLDGVVWTPRTTGINGAQTSLQDMVASPTRIVALGLGGVTAVSTDGGLNWTIGNLGSGVTDTLFGATYTLNKFWGASGDTGRIFSSADGVTWTSVATPASALRGLVYGAGRLVAVGANGVIVTSPDGTNWTLAQSGTTNQLIGVNFVNGRFVAVGVLGTILTSPDGLVWTPRSAAGNQSNLQNTAYGNGRYVIAGQGGRVILTSTDSENWSILTAGPAQGLNLLGITASSSTAVAVGASGTILSSTDKIAWINRTTANTNPLNDIHHAFGKFMAVGNTGSVMTSTDEGATWTWHSLSAVLGTTGLNGVRYSPVISRWIVAGAGGAIFTAADGTTFTWTRQTTGTSQILRKVALSGSLHVVVGNAGTILSSADGTTWTARTSGTTAQLNDVAFGNNTWVAVGNIGTVVTSGDATTWTAKQLGSFNFTSVNYLNGHFIATGGSNAYFTSTDGINWTGRTTGAADPLNDNVLFGGEVVGVGNFGTILTAGTPEIAGGGTINAPGNSPVTLKFAVGNSPIPVTYTWTKDGNAYAGPNAPVLTFASATGGDAGVYRVTATNAFGSATSSPYTLSLNVPVAITVAPTPQTALAGGTATFSVTATGTPAPTYQWRRNGIELVGATSSTLTFTNLHPNDAGPITVAVTNASGTVVSTPVALTVNPVAPVIQGPLSAFAVAGAPFLYQINTNATAATFGATGLPNGLTLATASGVISGTPTQTGPFNVSITATNVSGSDTQTLVLTVQPPVPVITSAASATARVGQAFSYTITAANSPTSFLAFNLPAGLSLTGATISGTPTTAGFYAAQVSAANATGIASQGLSIQVQPPLDAPVYSGPANISGTAGSAFTFTPNFGGSVASWALVNLPDGTPSALPTGITLNPTTGVISGTTTQSGTFRIALQATAGSGATTTQVLTFTFNPPASAPLVTSSGSAVGTVGSLFSYTITTNPAATTFGATGLPNGLTLNTGTGVITGFPTEPGISTVTLTVGNLTGSSTTPLTITVNSSASAPIITSAPVATGTVGVDFVFSLTASNTPTHFAVTSGSLPAGLVLNAATGAITEKPTAAGQFRVWVAASNVAGGRGPAVEMLFDIARALNVPVITSNGTAAGQVGQPFRYQITATNTPTGYALTGTLPGGLTFDSATGVISGVPSSETATPVSVTLAASNADGASAPKTLAITIAPAPATPRITSALAASGRVGVAFTYQITASDTPTSYSSDALPAGLTLNATSGAITGTPSAAGVFPVQIRAANAAGLGQASTLTITIASPLLAPAITSDATANAKVGVLFSYQITATGDPTSFNVSGTLPAGLSLNTTTGLLSGNPADNPGLYTVTLTATNATGTSQPQSLLINVAPADATPVITSSATAVGQVNVPFTYQITATNVPSTTPFPPSVFLDAVGLPPGLAVNPSTGLIQGTPSAAGTYTVSLVGINANGTGALRSLTITISPAATAPVIGGSLAVNAQAGTAFSYQIVATNNPTSFGALDAPVWLSVNTGTGLLSGTPTGPGAYTIRLTASNSGGTSNEAALSLTVYAAPNTPVVTNGDTATGRVGQAFTYQITASNSPTSYVATGLPAGLTFNGTAGTISGTPTTSGTFTVTLSAVNANGEGNRVTLTLTISPSLTIAG